MKRAAAIHTGPFTHLDHLAPISEHFDLLLIVCDEKALAIGREFYPQVEVALKHPAELSLDYLATSFDTIFTCGKFWALELRPLLQLFHGKRMRFVFCPHGNSDKETRMQNKGAGACQDVALVYGPQMEGLMKDCSDKLITIGNQRLEFYRRHQAHFDRLLEEKIPLNPNKKSILYAPTWETMATGSSFISSADAVIDQLSGEYNLLIKAHPLLEEAHPAHFFLMGEKCKALTDVHFIDDFPAIYPLLEKTDIYLGDYSSIGYDFLIYNRPMFFLSEKSDLLHSCGTALASEELSDKIHLSQAGFSKRRREVYEIAYGNKNAPLLQAGHIF